MTKPLHKLTTEQLRRKLRQYEWSEIKYNRGANFWWASVNRTKGCDEPANIECVGKTERAAIIAALRAAGEE